MVTHPSLLCFSRLDLYGLSNVCETDYCLQYFSNCQKTYIVYCSIKTLAYVIVFILDSSIRMQ